MSDRRVTGRYRSLSLACATTASHLRHLHREVVYVFSSLWNGIILRKARRNRLPSLLLFLASSDDVAITDRLPWLVPVTERGFGAGSAGIGRDTGRAEAIAGTGFRFRVGLGLTMAGCTSGAGDADTSCSGCEREIRRGGRRSAVV